MDGLFLKVLNMSFAASWLIGAVVLLRLVLKKAPKWLNCALWAVVAVRLLCPFSLESALSLLPSQEPIPADFVYMQTPQIQTGVETIDRVVNPVLAQRLTPDTGASVNPAQVLTAVLTAVWVAGMAGLGLFALLSYWKLHRRVSPSLKLEDNVRICDDIPTPFILGIVRPKIYIPSTAAEEQLPHILVHERAHLKRHDHWWKPLGYLVLTVHWFNPLVWLAYILLCRDIELACDEKVIGALDREQSVAYSEALLSCGVNRRSVLVCPLAFGEVGVKERVKRVLNYRKPAFLLVLAAVVASLVVGVCFLTSPGVGRSLAMQGSNLRDLEPEKLMAHIVKAEHLKYDSLYTNPDSAFDIVLTGDFDFENDGPLVYFYPKRGSYYSGQVQLQKNPCQYYLTETVSMTEPQYLWSFRNYVEALKNLPQEEIRALTPNADRYCLEFVAQGTPDDYERVLTYTESGITPINGWLIHFKVTPYYGEGGEAGYDGAAAEAVHVFYGPEAAKLVLDGTYKGVSVLQNPVLSTYIYETEYTFVENQYRGVGYTVLYSVEGFFDGGLSIPPFINSDLDQEALIENSTIYYFETKVKDGLHQGIYVFDCAGELYLFEANYRIRDGVKEYAVWRGYQLTKQSGGESTDGVWDGTPEELLEMAKKGGYLVSESGSVTAGKELWQAFLEKTQRGEAASVRLAQYYDANQVNPSRTYLWELTYREDGYTLAPLNSPSEPVKIYRYLCHSVEKLPTSDDLYEDIYFLTNEPDWTWLKIQEALRTSSSFMAIPDFAVAYWDIVQMP